MTVTTLGRCTAQTIGLVLSDAFRDEALAAWIVPDPVARPVLLARLFVLTAAQALTEGTVDVVDDPHCDSWSRPHHGNDDHSDRASDSSGGGGRGGGGGLDLSRQVNGSQLKEDEGVVDPPRRAGGRLVGAALWLDYSRPGDISHEPDPAMVARVVDVLGEDAAGRWQTAMTAMAEVHPRCSHQYLALIGVSDDRQNRGLGAALLRHRLRVLDNTMSGAYLEATSLDSRAFYARWGFHDLARPLTVPDDGPTVWPMYRDPCPYGLPRA